MLRIIKYIFSKNSGLNILKFLIFAFLFQFYKRIIGGIFSIKIFNGKSIFLFPKCHISTMFAYTDIPDKDEITMLRSMCNKDTVFLDIGANIGSYSVCMMDVCSNIIAFEPHPFTSRRCKMNFLLNNLSEKNVFEIALSDKNGTALFSDFGGSSTVNHIVSNNINETTIEVKTCMLDSFVNDYGFSKNNNYLLKIDVEGFEENIFDGGRDFLQNFDVRGIVFECFETRKVFDILNKYGFVSIQKISENNYIATKTYLG